MVLKPVTAVPEASWVSCQVSHKFLQLLPNLCLPLMPSQGTKGTSESAQPTETPLSVHSSVPATVSTKEGPYLSGPLLLFRRNGCAYLVLGGNDPQGLCEGTHFYRGRLKISN